MLVLGDSAVGSNPALKVGLPEAENARKMRRRKREERHCSFMARVLRNCELADGVPMNAGGCFENTATETTVGLQCCELWGRACAPTGGEPRSGGRAL